MKSWKERRNENPSKITEIIDDDRCWIPRHMIYIKFRQFYRNNPLVQRVLVKKNLKPLEMAKVALVGTELEKYYKMGFSDTLILKKLNNRYTSKEISGMTMLIWDLDPNSVRLMLHMGILKEN